MLDFFYIIGSMVFSRMKARVCSRTSIIEAVPSPRGAFEGLVPQTKLRSPKLNCEAL